MKNEFYSNIELLKSFVNTIIEEQSIKLELFYYELNQNESVLVLNNQKDNLEIVESLSSLCDINNIILTIDSNKKILISEMGFVENNISEINESLIKFPRKELMNTLINESLSMFNTDNSLGKKDISLNKGIQSNEYKKEYYNEYNKIINSNEYKKRRYKETYGVSITRKSINTNDLKTRIGFAIIGNSSVVDN